MIFTPFLDLHRRAGGNHPIRGLVCFVFDLALRICQIILVLGILVMAWKTLY